MWKLCRTDLIKWWVKQEKSEGFKWETYQSFRNYIWWLTRFGLIECVASKQSDKRWFKRRYYKLV